MLERETLKPLSIDAQTNNNFSLKPCLGFGNQLYLSHACKPLQEGCPNPQAVSDLGENHKTIFKVKWNLDMQNKNMRELVCQSRYIFMEVQDFCRNRKATNATSLNKQFGEELVGFSEQYRLAIRTTTTSLRKSLNNTCMEGEEREEVVEALEMFDMCELVWSLCQVLFLSHNQAGMGVVSQLMAWFKLRFHDDSLYEQVLSHPQPHLHPLFWNLVTTLVMQGSMQEACNLLDTHPQQTEPFQTMHFLLNNMPAYSPATAPEWMLHRQEWRQLCMQHLHEAVFADHPPLNNLCRILLGEEDVFTEHIHLLPSWYCLLISQLYFQDPSTPAADLRIHATGCIERFGVGGKMTTWDEILLCIVQMDVKQAVATYCKSFSNWWFSCHLTDLLHHAACIPHKILNYGSDLREYLLLDYASSLLSCPSLTAVAIDYFSSCPVYGRWHMGEVIDRVGVVNDKQAEKMLSICTKHALLQQGNQVSRRQALNSMRNGRYSSALKWCVVAKDASLSKVLVKRILERVELQDLHHLDVLSHLPHYLTFSDHLVFLGKLVEYERKVEVGRVAEAVVVLMTLFNEKKISKNYWPVMFQHVLPVLQDNKVELSGRDAQKLLQCIDEHEEETKEVSEHNRSIILSLRLYLADCLVYAFFQE